MWFVLSAIRVRSTPTSRSVASAMAPACCARPIPPQESRMSSRHRADTKRGRKPFAARTTKGMLGRLALLSLPALFGACSQFEEPLPGQADARVDGSQPERDADVSDGEAETDADADVGEELDSSLVDAGVD